MQVKAIEFLESIPEGKNHFELDLFHMGVDVDKDLLIMFAEFENNPYIILCNKKTGERTRIWLDLTPRDPRTGSWHIGRYLEECWQETGTVPVVEAK